MINVTQSPWNVRPGQGDCTQALQNVFDNVTTPATVYCPSGRYGISAPLSIGRDHINLVGDGEATVFAQSGYNPTNTLHIGIPEVNQGGQSVGPADLSQAGSMWGLRTDGTKWVQVQAHPLQLGGASKYGYIYPDYFEETTELCIDTCFAPDPKLPWKPYSFLFGLGDAANTFTSAPYSFWTGPDPSILLFAFRTADIPDTAYACDHLVTIHFADLGTPPYKLRVDTNLTTGKVTAYTGEDLKPVAVGIVESPSATKKLASGKMNFASNCLYPFMVGLQGMRGNWGVATTPLILYGYRVSRTFEPAFGPWTKTPQTIGYFPPFDPNTIGRTIPVGHGPGQGDFDGTAIVFNSGGNGNPTAFARVRGIAIQSAAGRGMGIAIGSIFDLRIEDCTITNGSIAVGTYNSGSNYMVYARDGTFQSFNCTYYGCSQALQMRGMTLEGGGRDVLRFTGCNVDIDGGFATHAAPNASTMMSCYSADGGGSYAIRGGFSYDCEGEPHKKAGIYVERHYGVQTLLELDDVDLGQSTGAPAILLRGMNPISPPQWRQARASIRGLKCAGYTPTVAFADIATPAALPVAGGGSYSAEIPW